MSLILENVIAGGLKTWSYVTHLLSCEFFLTYPKRRANGGDIILLRALIIGLEFFLLAIIISNWIDPTRGTTLSWIEFLNQTHDHISWLGAIFAAAYAALYTRFASQWTYLANLYNQIKQAEARTAQNSDDNTENRIAEWKAGFMEDADILHLATKGIFVSVMKAWGEQELVKDKFIQYTFVREEGFNDLMEDVKRALQRQEKEFEKRLNRRRKNITK